MIYTSVKNDYIKNLKKLEQTKYRSREQKFLVSDKHLVIEAYNKGLLEEILVLENNNYDLDIKTNYCSKNVLDHLSNLSSGTDIIGVVKIKENKTIGNKVIILDNIQDPGNLGTIIRSAVSFNLDTIILSENSVSEYNPKTIQATKGALFNINIIKDNLVDTINKLKDNYLIYGTDVSGGIELKNIKKEDKIAIVMGSEGSGISNEVKELLNDFIYIPINNMESLNVAVATSIILYEINR